MQTAIPLLFRFVGYVLFGMVLETIFSMDGIGRALGCKVPRRVPKKYLEGFVSAYMIPLHGLGVLFVLEPLQGIVAPWPWLARFVVYAVSISLSEIAWGWLLDKTIGFYPWDYYALSRWKIFSRGYSLWTLVPLWGLAGMLLEHYSRLLRFLSPYVAAFYGYPLR
jgi:hypothetical protein